MKPKQRDELVRLIVLEITGLILPHQRQALLDTINAYDIAGEIRARIHEALEVGGLPSYDIGMFHEVLRFALLYSDFIPKKGTRRRLLRRWVLNLPGYIKIWIKKIRINPYWDI
ncbi:hypothetical protein J2T02_002633 [Chitinophaga terrae (ex Kim and Jung 2007)]|uniref:hypothetical protein n=1 Tax=Chitinophaga terrae (ex Kim and Jung 2007) TaxID=408074 RepID=UPI002784C802|nr:hypothetical protein [Chitinophaga terrae (ex Kim and Jung 2007)]MDQ0107514.1 hypothetical protein [Chitinophaga terrae (ex Kim and Jung 2007)]